MRSGCQLVHSRDATRSQSAVQTAPDSRRLVIKEEKVWGRGVLNVV